jgi:AraC-like DNA-binding protein
MGKSLHCVDGQFFELSTGDFILIPPDIPHRCEYEDYFSDSTILFSSCNLPKKPVVIHDIDGNAGKLFDMIEKLYVEKEFHYKKIIESLLDALLCYIEKSIELKVKYSFVYAFKDELYENISNADFDIGVAIHRSGYNIDYFRRCFKKEFGKNPLDYLTSLRIRKAKQCLTQSEFSSIEEVASQCGFADSFYFSTCFKKHSGMAPLKYRKMKLSEKNQ